MSESKISAVELERLAVEEVQVAGQMGVIVDEISAGEVRARVPYRDSFLRPGGTVAGPVLMALADFVMWGVVMSLIGPVKLAVTTSLNINFLRRPGPGDVVAVGRILKLGKRLAVGEVYLYTGGSDHLVAHVTCTYSIPPTAED
ncbi:MAG: PaaI family thioesterase [Gammaproteobacteria bacterium]|nr:PaaI family thioesterase [Gammaproteobacteria bacterium]